MPPLPPQKAYELWLIPAQGAPIPAGVFKPGSSRRRRRKEYSYPTLSCPAAVWAALVASIAPAAHATLAWLADGEAYIPSTMVRSLHDTTLLAFITFGTTSQSSPPLSASAVAGAGCQRDGVGTGYGFAAFSDWEIFPAHYRPL